ncbi:MAG: V-type ATPase 116kDa subunit family protein [Candidatus Micrarchaeota archaeon]
MKAKMKVAKVAVHRKNAAIVAESLQSMGMMHLSFEDSHSFERQDEDLGKFDYILNYPYFEKEKKDVVENFASLERKIEAKSVKKLALKGLAGIGAYDELKAMETRIAGLVKRRESLLSLSSEIRSLHFKVEFPMHKLGETNRAKLFLVKGKPPEGPECEKVGEEVFVCSSLKEQTVEANQIQLNLLGLTGTPKEMIAKATSEEKELAKQRIQLIAEARKHQENIVIFKAAHDYLRAEKRKSEALMRSKGTKNTILISGWIRERDEEKIASLKGCEFELSDPEGDNAPTDLDNGPILKPLETVTKVFGVPRYTEVDPTPYLAVFFVLSMALCLTDAGYGLMLAVLASILYLKYGLKFAMLLLYAGIVAIVVGVLIGGWWGDLGNSIPLFRPILYPNGITPIDFLVLSLSIGILQITLSQLIAAREKLRKGDWVSALLDHVPWVVFLLAIASIGLDMAGAISFKYGIYIAGGCVLLVILTRGRNEKSILGKIVSGIFSPYDLVAYMGDILSFSRLLALGLTSGLIASAINLLAMLSWGIPLVGIILAPLILILGHTFNLLLSTLSAYIHSSRLQYVEFFNRFYSGGGFSFQPFSKNYRYFKEV